MLRGGERPGFWDLPDNFENHGANLIPHDGLLVPRKKTDLKFEFIT